MFLLPGKRLLETGAAVELSLLSVEALPGGGGLADVAQATQPFAIVVDPALEPRPLPQQRLVSDLDGGGVGLGVAVAREEPVGRQRVEKAVGRAAIRERLELGARHPASGVLGSLPESHHP
jgi:hypothetical protein